jgi:hypothetical protein
MQIPTALSPRDDTSATRFLPFCVAQRPQKKLSWFGDTKSGVDLLIALLTYTSLCRSVPWRTRRGRRVSNHPRRSLPALLEEIESCIDRRRRHSQSATGSFSCHNFFRLTA